MTIKASDLFVACLEEEGVEVIFGLPGEENLDLLESLRTSSIRLVVTRHEQHAAFMAATWGRLTGRAGVCLATLGPGATNLITGIAHAQLGGMPLVAITGQKAIHDNREGQFQIIDVVGTLRPLTKWNRSIVYGSAIPHQVRQAFKTAEAERPGAVHLELPEDVAREQLEGVEPHRRTDARRPVPDGVALDRGAALLADARRPLLLVSAGANRKRIGRRLESFLAATGLYAVVTQMGKGVLPDDDPHSLFTLGIHRRDYVHAAIDAADLVVTLGYDPSEYPPFAWNPDGDKPILHVDFSAAEQDRYYEPHAEVVGDIAHALDGLERRLEGVSFDVEHLAELRAFIAERLEEGSDSDAFPVKPQRLVHDVRAVLDREDILSLDNGIYKLWFARRYPAYVENTVLLDNALATMGAGLGAAMAAKMVHPERRVLAVCGDGGFLMNSQDLETAVRLGQDLVVLIVRDGGYGFIRWKQDELDLPDFAMEFGNPDFVRYAEAYGARGMRVESAEALEPTLREAFDAGGVVIVDCPIDYTENAALSRRLDREAKPLCDQETEA